MILSIDIQHNSIEGHYAECRYAKCHDHLNVMLSVVMLNVIMLSVVRLNVVLLSVVRLNAVMLSVVAPQNKLVPFGNSACHAACMQRTDGTAYFVGAASYARNLLQYSTLSIG
jgi:hypothetical protein